MKRANPRNKIGASSCAPVLNLHQCKQCGLVYHTKAEPVFSWDRRFMVDKCDACRGFGYGTRAFGGNSLWRQSIPSNRT